MNSADHHLLSKVSPKTKLIFWITNKSLSPQLEGFKAADYLLNGLLTHTLGQNPVIENHLFVGEQFNRSLYIYFSNSLNVNLSSIKDAIKPDFADDDIYIVWGDKDLNTEFMNKLNPEWRERCLDI